ncbi:unnamed protein product [Arctogadus glacialis]
MRTSVNCACTVITENLDIKMKITKKAAECRSFTYNGNKICIHSDVRAETLKLRATFKEVPSSEWIGSTWFRRS